MSTINRLVEIAKIGNRCPICGGLLGNCNCERELARQAFLADINDTIRLPLKTTRTPTPTPNPRVQKVIAENLLSEHLSAEWMFKTQLQSGAIIIEKEVDVETVTNNVIEQTNKQVETLLSDVDKQVALAIDGEKVKLKGSPVTRLQ